MILVTEKDYLETYSSRKAGKRVLKDYKNWFPVKASSELARLVADLTTDGHVQPYPKLRFDFTSGSKQKLYRFERRLIELFDIEGSIRENTTNPHSKSFNYGVNSKPLTRILILCGVPTGKKVRTEFRIPPWIANRKEFFRAYVERIYANDGSAYGKNPRITLLMHKEERISKNLRSFMRQLNSRLDDYFNISGSVYQRSYRKKRKEGYIAVGIGLNIRSNNAIKKFHEEFSITDLQMASEISKSVDR